MKKVLLILGILALATTPAIAQECCPKWEVFLGYIYFNASAKGDLISSDQFENRYGSHGISGSLTYNISEMIGLTADLGGNRRSSVIDRLTLNDTTSRNADTEIKKVTFLFGPRFSARSEGINYFLQTLVGGVSSSADATGVTDANPGTNVSSEVSSTDFALAIGGGVDIDATKNFAVRLFSFDYIPVRAGRDGEGGRTWSHNYRLRAGIIIRWGLIK
jgi:opacity protein-like surface antigen